MAQPGSRGGRQAWRRWCRGDDATDVLPASTVGRVYWDLEGVFADKETIVVAQQPPRHWVLRDLTLVGEITYPFSVAGPPRSAGEGSWYTVSEDRTAVHIWTL